MTKTKREYVSNHIYKTPSGMYYDDRGPLSRKGVPSPKRVSRKRGEASARSRERMKSRVRDEDGKLGFKLINVSTDGRTKGEHRAKYYERPAEVSVSYDPDVNEELALRNATQHLDEDEEGVIHFNVEIEA